MWRADLTPTRWALVALVVGASAAAILLPYLPRGTDLYVHVLWPWQVMRCLGVGALPVWLPDLNAGFGSPGIGLYSPLAPALSGALGLILGTSGRGVRAALVLAAALVFVVAPGRNRRDRFLAAVAAVLAPAVVIEFFGRFPVAQLLSLPLALVLLDRAVGRGWSWKTESLPLAVLWLFHAPTALMVAMLASVSVVAGRSARWAQRSADVEANVDVLRPMGDLVLTALAAAALSAWHWWPMLSAAASFPMRAALTGGQHHPMRNLIGSANPHLIEINIAMGWTAIGLLVCLLISGGWRKPGGRLAVFAVFLASWPSAPIWQLATPMVWLQFPWRFLVPATLLTVPAVMSARHGKRGVILASSALAFFVPLAGIPAPRLASDPGLTLQTLPVDAGARVARSFDGNPLLVDVMEHRPHWWSEFGPTLAQLGQDAAVLFPAAGSVRIEEWRPLRRRLTVDSPAQTTLVLRLLDDDHWWVMVDGSPVVHERWGAALAVRLPAGASSVVVEWQTDWRASVGIIVALVALAGIIVVRRRMATSSQSGHL